MIALAQGQATKHIRGNATRKRQVKQLGHAATTEAESRFGDQIVTLSARRSRSRHSRPTVIIVEYRDEVYARLAADIARFEVDIIRTESVESTRLLVSRCDSALVIANRDLPEHSGWLLAEKVRRMPHVELWMYLPCASKYASVLAEVQQVSELIEYRGDLFMLSDLLLNRFEDWRNAAMVAQQTEALVAA